jgi:hypothetical protein
VHLLFWEKYAALMQRLFYTVRLLDTPEWSIFTLPMHFKGDAVEETHVYMISPYSKFKFSFPVTLYF